MCLCICAVCKFQVANMLCGKAQRWLRCTVDVHRSHLLSTGARRILVRKTVILVKWAKMTGPTIDLPKEVCMFAHRLVDLLCSTSRLINMAKVSKNQGDASTNNPKAPAPDVYKSAVWTVFLNSWIWCQCQWEWMCSVRPSQSRIILACGDAHGQLWTPWMSSPSCSIFSPSPLGIHLKHSCEFWHTGCKTLQVTWTLLYRASHETWPSIN